ncbi:hypothetical protein [Novosphingobium sp. CCH12-A3]|uniref:hypothetical protein n=1 Tax=Novosphingobium sp. CCH12-A3 TaxID=1768752 RepID=UPI0007862156|nr:hypothetical protein [Novosphingobium sp. CCH12-A3]
MTPQEFLNKWRQVELKERSASQSHFIYLCALLGVLDPITNLYNARPAWLDHAHRVLDEAVADAYGWGDDFRAGLLTDDEILARLFRLNQKRAGK